MDSTNEFMLYLYHIILYSVLIFDFESTSTQLNFFKRSFHLTGFQLSE